MSMLHSTTFCLVVVVAMWENLWENMSKTIEGVFNRLWSETLISFVQCQLEQMYVYMHGLID